MTPSDRIRKVLEEVGKLKSGSPLDEVCGPAWCSCTSACLYSWLLLPRLAKALQEALFEIHPWDEKTLEIVADILEGK